MRVTIILQFCDDAEVWKAVQSQQFLEEIRPTEVWNKVGANKDFRMLLSNDTEEGPQAVFERCMNIIHKNILRHTGKTAHQVSLNMGVRELKGITITSGNNILVSTQSIEPVMVAV